MIKQDEFIKIPTKSKLYDQVSIKVLDIILKRSENIDFELHNSSGIFDKFEDMASLDEELCKKITGWTKSQFARFSKVNNKSTRY